MTFKIDVKRQTRRRAAVAVLVAFLLVPLLGMVALAVDYGYLLVVRTDLQRSADAAALAAVRDLIPADDGTQDLDAVRATVREYAAANVKGVNGFTVSDADITIGRFEPSTVYTNFTILNSGIYDTVRVTFRRDATANSPVSLFFARIFGINNSNVTATATAVLQKASIIEAGADILPFSIEQSVWDNRNPGDQWSIYGDGRIEDELGGTIPGNWGTLDIGSESNSTSDLNDQILNGLRQSDLNDLFNSGRIPTNQHIDSSDPWFSSADTGLSSGLKNAVKAVHGHTKLVPIYDTHTGLSGENLEYHVIGWGVVRVENSSWNGANNTSVTVKKIYTYDGELKAQSDLSNETGVIQGAYTSPVLVK